MNYFLDTIFLIHITLLQCLIATFFTKMNNSVGICVCLDNAIFRHSSSVPCLVG